MNHIPAHFQIKVEPIANPQAIIQVGNARFTVLSSRMLRLEYSHDAAFEDHPSQAFWYRKQEVPLFEAKRAGSHFEIITQHLHLKYRAQEKFARSSLSITLLENGVVWRYGDPDTLNLLGTARTLDQAFGKINLEKGLQSRAGWTTVDDARSLIFSSEGRLQPRLHPENIDLYFLGYGKDFSACLADFCKVSGRAPMIPRWVLGNWWSRYWAYTQQELSELMLQFRDHQVPLSVCIVDIDWHLEGWTGYTWNRALFPDPPGFIQFLHDLGLRTALNLHPADGVQAHEEMYPQMAEAMEIDPASQQAVPFDLEDPRFVKAYFELLHHPQEANGVDFWWMDWQQGNPSRLPGLNLLWWINHLHFHDLGRDGSKRSFIFSRWGGLGNHRYPIGFSGDTVISWESLAFQPYFTATAANVNYGWWSHDIGGHMGGSEDAELYTRWVQLGVFSPVFRLHCTKNRFHERRPWGYDAETLRLTRHAMQLRHALIPYLYSMAWRNHQTGIPLVCPMYYLDPDTEAAYACPNQYTFGSELVAAPFISPRHLETRLSRQVIWLPEGDWFDFFSGRHFTGGWRVLYGALEEIPVFARAGAIVPQAPLPDWGGLETSQELTLHIFPGADNRFELYEDDGVSNDYLDGKFALTPFTTAWAGDRLDFAIHPATGKTDLLPAQRSYTLVFYCLEKPESIEMMIDGVKARPKATYNPEQKTLTVSGLVVTPSGELSVRLQTRKKELLHRGDDLVEDLSRMLASFDLNNHAKSMIDNLLSAIVKDPNQLGRCLGILTRTQLRAFLEALLQSGVERTTNAGEELVILWNNQEHPQIHYRLNQVRRRGQADDSRNMGLWGEAVPRFQVIRPVQAFGRRAATLQFSYGDLLKIVHTFNTDSPSSAIQDGLY